MARNRFRKSKKQGTSRRLDGPVWSNSHRLELLAFLNWCVQQEKGPEFFTLVAGHLKQATKKIFTKLQIRQKLDREWRKRGTCNRFSRLYFQETDVLEPLGAEDQSQLELIAMRLEKEPPKAGRFLRCALRQWLLRIANPSGLLSQHELPRADGVPVDSNDDSELSSSYSKPNLDGIILESKERESSAEAQPPPTPIETRLRIAEEKLLKAKGRELTLMNRISELKLERDDRNQCDRALPADPIRLRRVISRLQGQVISLEQQLDVFRTIESGQFAFSKSSL
ncbi:hypothetical protein Forpe1208_v005322 [Fusarium oxysporum f. sp. rapae]|uniref:Uncharacterized protein n=1 Tax=Fusarium oxysporum f. sp. rapae TaxID=485398 RepID=A0A8J5TY78_FUSOX|nr:hypothetical protein Forpe1208_v005322 [Fusarium oxysporum f. sp. rapae]